MKKVSFKGFLEDLLEESLSSDSNAEDKDEVKKKKGKKIPFEILKYLRHRNVAGD